MNADRQQPRRRQNVSQPFEDLQQNPLPRSSTPPPPRTQRPLPQDSVPFNPAQEPIVEIAAEEAQYETVETLPAIREGSDKAPSMYREAIGGVTGADKLLQPESPAGFEPVEDDHDPQPWEEGATLRSVREPELEVPESEPVSEEDEDLPEQETEPVSDPQLDGDDEGVNEGAGDRQRQAEEKEAAWAEIWEEALTVGADETEAVVAELLEPEDEEDVHELESSKVPVVRNRRAFAEGEPYLPICDPKSAEMQTFVAHMLGGMAQLDDRIGRKVMISFHCQPISTKSFRAEAKSWLAAHKQGGVSTEKTRRSFLGWRGKMMVVSLICFLIAYLTKAANPVGLYALLGGVLFALPMLSSIAYVFKTGERLGGGKAPEKEKEDKPDEAHKELHKEVRGLVNSKLAAGKFFAVTLDVTAFNTVDAEEADEEAEELGHLVESISSGIEASLEDNEHNYLSWEETDKIDGGIDALQSSPPVRSRGQAPLILSNAELATMIKVPDDTLRQTQGVNIQYSKVRPLHPRVMPVTITDVINPPKGLVPIGRLTNATDNSALAVENKTLDKHMIVVGGSGTGKSVHASHISNGVVNSDYPLVVIDPHGSLVDDVLRALCAYRPERLKDIVLINISDADFPPALNPLAVSDFDHVPQAVNATLKLLEDTQNFSGGNAPQARQYAHMILEAMAAVNVLIWRHIDAKFEDPAEADAERRISLLSPLHMIDFLTDPEFRHPIVELANGHGVPNIAKYFYEDFDDPDKSGLFIKQAQPKQLEIIQPIQRVFAGLSNDKLFTRALAMDNRLNFAELINDNKIILCRLGRFSGGANLGVIVAQMMLSEILGSMEVWGRIKDPMTGEYRGRGLRLLIDETPVVARGNEALLGFILAEARKYDFGLISYSQFLDQLDPQLQKEFKANTKTKISLNLDATQAKIMAANIGDEVTEKDITNLPLYTAYGKVLVDERTGADSGPFAMSTLPPLPAADQPQLDPELPAKLAQVVQQSREQIANPAQLADERIAKLTATASQACFAVYKEWIEGGGGVDEVTVHDLEDKLEQATTEDGINWHNI